MAETTVYGAIRRDSSGDRPNSAKRNRTHPPPLSPRDLISDLPDAAIHHIFSFLPLKDVVKTSVLSKRWQSAWTTTAHLVFHDTCSSDFPSLVDSVLIRCTSPTVKRFHVTIFKCNEAYRPKLDLWPHFAERRRVEDLRLGLVQQQVHYKLPRFLYCLSWLVRLEVYSCCLSLGTAIRWPCLKVLLLGCAELSDNILEGIVKGSPVLESLELHYCSGVKNIVIDSTGVKELKLVKGHRLSDSETIWALHLLSLRVSGTWRLGSVFRLDDVSSLVEAELDFVVRGDKSHDLIKELLKKLHGVSTITIGGWCLEFMLDEESIERFNFDKDLLSRKGNFQCLAKHLERVKIIGFADSFGSKHLLSLIKFLLDDALALEKMIIKADLHAQRGQKRLGAADLSELLGVSRNVLSYRRASQNAEVIFNYPLEEVSFKKPLK